MSVRRRTLTRIAWLGLTQQQFAHVIRMDKGSFSRTLHSERPRPSTTRRIAFGLGMSVDDLESGDPGVLLGPHPGIPDPDAVRVEDLRAWFDANYTGDPG